MGGGDSGGTCWAGSIEADRAIPRTVAVPASGGSLTFHVTRDTEPTWDFFFVEAHTAGQDDWTTLPDENGHTSQSTGSVCPFWLGLHPFLEHYQAETDDGGCEPSGTTGEWQVAWHAEGRAAKRFAGRHQLELFAGISNSALSSTTGAYRWGTVGAVVRLGL